MSGRGRGRGRGGGRGGRGGGPMSASQQYFMASATEAGIDIRNMQRAGLGGVGSAVFPDLELHSSGERRLHPHELDGGGGSEAMREDGRNDDNMGGGMMMKRESPASAKRTASLITKMREMHHSMRTSAFYIRTEGEFPGVDRYIVRGGGDDDVINKATMSRPSTTATTTSSSDVVDVDAWCGKLSTQCLGGRKRTRGEGGGVFVPEELCVDSRRLTGGGEGGTAARRMRKLNLTELAAKIKRDGSTLTDQQRQGNEIDGEDDDGAGEEGDVLEDGEESDGADYAANYYESEGEDMSGSDGEPTF